MPYGIPYTDAQRQERHEAIYGAGSPLPPRGTYLRATGAPRFANLATDNSTLILLGAGALLVAIMFFGRK